MPIVRKCNNCGMRITSKVQVCPSCGMELSLESAVERITGDESELNALILSFEKYQYKNYDSSVENHRAKLIREIENLEVPINEEDLLIYYENLSNLLKSSTEDEQKLNEVLTEKLGKIGRSILKVNPNLPCHEFIREFLESIDSSKRFNFYSMTILIITSMAVMIGLSIMLFIR